MEASAYYQQFERNIDIIFDALQVGLNLRTTALATSLPLEIYVLCEVLNQGGAEFRLTSEGVARVAEFMEQFQPRKAETQAIMARLLQDQRAVMRTPEGRVLTKEMLIRRLEYFNEAARQMNVMRTQQALGSPDQHKSGIGAALQK
ncbi:hypothetical protein [Hymenobacter psychrotolerans]|uniref:Uncharacterized protein n=1 Tax=Hymenobacter psychrotolerans DSM 18569 TaxID=1121959 RepID=A0A1M6RQ54_9BACT|nr:hypothetical protein [Hymenobacter psychrotolerans]SHK34622.1 hypothetical protein SAMN02746009_00767 [Hymenobacter psychrotolerans DSM 18569]